MRLSLFLLLLCCSAVVSAQNVDVTKFGVTPNSFSDATEGVKKATEACRGQSGATLVFPEGRYDFWPDKAEDQTYYITNSSSEEEVPVKKQRVGLLFKGLKNVKVEGNNSLFVFHGKMISWVLDGCENVRLQNIKVDYERPGMSEMTIKEIGPGSVTATIHPDSKFAIVNGVLQWYGDKWVSKHFFAILVNPAKGLNRYSSWSPFLKSMAEVIAPLTVRFTGDFSQFKAEPGEVLTIRDHIRDYIGAFVNRSKNISLHNVHMQYMHGLGIVSQFSENLHYDSVFIEPAKGRGRVIASSADGMHFSGCKGQITIENCRFKGLHDDAVNVHGTHLKITEVVSPTSMKIRFMHGQTYGFEAFIAGDTVAYVHPSSLQIFEKGVVKSARLISEREMLVELAKPVPSQLAAGDVLENVTWTPALTIRNSRIEGTNTRGILITTRRKVLVENNVFYRTGMHAILIENDASGWFESGPVEDVTIRGNVFEECAYNSYPNNYVIHISPQNKEIIKGYWVHKNISIENNTFKVYDYPLLSAKSTNGLTFIGNKIIKTDFMKAGEKRPEIHLVSSTKARVRNNVFEPKQEAVVDAEKMGKRDINTDLKVHMH